MKPSSQLERFRARDRGFETMIGEWHGLFRIPIDGRTLLVISSGDLDDWEHVSVSLPNRCPNWPEMSRIKNLFWGEDETVLQFHPKQSEYVNNHPYCLHLWKKKGVDHELPPSIAVGFKGIEVELSNPPALNQSK